MKKNGFNLGMPRQWLPPKLILIMKLTTFLLIVALAQVSAKGFGQRVSLNETHAPLEKILKLIRAQSGYEFIYDVQDIKDQIVSVNLNDVSMEEAVKESIKGLPLTFKIVQKNIVITKKDPTFLERLANRWASIDASGYIVDSEGNPLPGASVSIKGKGRSVSTDGNGKFFLKGVEEGALLVVTFVGYLPKEVKAAVNMGNIVLELSDSKLEEVEIVNTGYQNIPKERATGSFAQPNKEIYTARVTPDIISRLEGITSGLLFNRSTSITQEGQTDINIRGRSTIYSNDQPLIVIDNFPYNGNINDINPQDVESIDILKDAAAASIWGVRAGNGVIVITTKKGKANEATRINLSANITVGRKPNLKYDPNFLASNNYIDVQQYLFKLGRYDADLTDNYYYPSIPGAVEVMAAARDGRISKQDSANKINSLKSVDIRDGLSKYFYRQPINQQYALNISSSTKNSIYYFSSGYDKLQSNQKTYDKDRLTLNFSNSYTPIKNLDINTQFNYVISNNHSGNPLNLGSATSVGNIYYPYTAFADGSGKALPLNRGFSNQFITQAAQNNYFDWSYKPLDELNAEKNFSKTTEIRIFSGIKYSFLKEFSVEGKYQYEQYNTSQTDLRGLDMYSTRNLINAYSILSGKLVTGYNIPVGDIYSSVNTFTSTNNLRGQFNYSHSGKNALNAILGAEVTEYKNNSNSNILYGYNSETDSYTPVDNVNYFVLNPAGYGSIPNFSGVKNGIDRYRSVFATASYTYDNKYTVSGSARQDASNYFGVVTNQKKVPLWSAGIKWNISNESFFKLSWLPILQFRTTYGYNGNLNKSVTGVTTFLYNTNSPITNLPYATISNLGNPQLRWEKNAILNLGIDFGIKNNVLTGSLEYFVKKGVDLIGDQALAPSVGFISPSTGTNVLRGNFANMKGNGVDVQLISKNINGAFSWVTNLNFSYATDKVTRYDQITNNFGSFAGTGISILPNIGKPVYGLYSYKFASLDHNTGDPQGYVNNSVSKDYYALTNPSSLDDLVYSGPARPRYFGGLGNRFAYKDFSILFNFSFKLGYYFRRSTINYSNLVGGSGGGHEDYDLRWQKPGDELKTTVPSLIYPADSQRDLFYSYSEATIEKGDHIRLQDISLSYDIHKQVKSLGFPLRKLQIFAYANNIGIIWRSNKQGLDPDFPAGGIPNSRTISIGFKAEL